MLNNSTCYHGHDLIPTSEGPTRTHHDKKSETTIQWCCLENPSKQLIYLTLFNFKTFVERHKMLTTFVVETCLFLKACFLSCLFWKVLTFFGMCLLLELGHFDKFWVY